MGIFNYDGPLMQSLSKLADFIILNILFIACCLPVVTIGASCSALYTVTLKMVKNEESYVTKTFFKAFKDNFKISTFCWLILGAIGAVLWIDFRIAPQLFKGAAFIMQTIFGALGIILGMVMLYVFPYIARFENTLKNTLKNSALIAVSNFPYTLLLLVITVLLPLLSSFITIRITGIFWILIGAAVIAYLNSVFFRKIFLKYEPKEEEPEEECFTSENKETEN